MGLYRRKDSRFWWMWLEPPTGDPPRAESTKIRIDAPTPELRKDNRALAEHLYHTRLLALSRSAAGVTPKLSIAFDVYAEWYEMHVCAAHGSVVRERSMLKRLRLHFKKTPLAHIDKAAVLEWRTERCTKVSASTADRELDVLKSLFVSAVPKYLQASPIAGLKRHRDTAQAVKRRPRVLSLDEEARILKAAKDDPQALALFLLAIDTLMRLSDVKELRRDRDYGTVIHVEAPKIAPYDVPVSTRLRKALDALPADGPFYFPKRWAGREGGISVNTVWRIFKALCQAAKVPVGRKIRGVTFHSLRHTGATRMLEAGVNPVAVKEIGGWLSMRQLDRYGHSSEETKQRAVNLIGRKPNVGRGSR